MSKIGIVARKFLKFHGLIAGSLAISSIGQLQASYTISTFAGNGTQGCNGDGGAAAAAEMDGPFGICRDSAGNIYFSDHTKHVIRKIDTSNPRIITTIAGSAGYSGLQNGTGSNALFSQPLGIAAGLRPRSLTRYF